MFPLVEESENARPRRKRAVAFQMVFNIIVSIVLVIMCSIMVFKFQKLDEKQEDVQTLKQTGIIKSATIPEKNCTPVECEVFGPRGMKGERGMQGETGVRGLRGSKGDRGVSGERGVSGLSGGKGDKGQPGYRGIWPERGAWGKWGDIGPKGEQGLPGRPGHPGAPGMKGVPGYEILASCDALKEAGVWSNGVYLIDPDGPYNGLDPFSVVCDMTSDLTLGYTVIHHDKEEEGAVKGYESAGSFRVNITYDIKAEQIEAVKNVSTTCKQFIKYKCIHSNFYYYDNGPFQYWISVDGNPMSNWGGAPTGTKGCGCWVTRSCDDANKRCNCDSNDVALRMDQGYLTNKTTLPVTQLRFGDTIGKDEKGHYFLGPLQCAQYQQRKK